MATCILNESNERTEKNIHLAITTLCDRNCKYCCNKFYSMDEIPTVTDAELKKAENVFLTGGEPFAYGNPVAIAKYLKTKYPNIQKVIVYTNAYELFQFFDNSNQVFDPDWHYIDGLNISIKNKKDVDAWDNINIYYPSLVNCKKYNRIYVFKDTRKFFVRGDWDLWDSFISNPIVSVREWQKKFVPADDSIFRRI